MTRVMYDSVDANQIPADAQMVAGYVDGRFRWSDAAWARFPHAVKVRIAVLHTTNDGHVLDVEPGNASPTDAVQWVQMRRKAGADPTVYCNASTWPSVRQAFQRASVAEPHYWIAAWNGQQTIPPGAVAHQYKTTNAYDVSIVADYWPGVDPAPKPQPQPNPTPSPASGAVKSITVTWTDANGQQHTIAMQRT